MTTNDDADDRRENRVHENTRRGFVTLLGATGTIALAGCADNGDEPADETPTVDDPDEDDQEPDEPDEDDEEPDDDPDEGDEDPDEPDEDDEDDEEPEGEQYELHVRVEDSAGDPVDGATVDVEDDNGMSVLEDQPETDADGEAFVDLPDGEYTVIVRADGFADAEEPVSIAGSDAEVTITLEETDGEDDENGVGDDEEDDENGVGDEDEDDENGVGDDEEDDENGVGDEDEDDENGMGDDDDEDA
ncbi:carboxypeptidase regulatory-like domain-containing protein [Halorubrum sp. DTA98]|uniref:carboxypeptidase-like regulatory domain-containing protein n=1 Tax=Halorubrum sp. DTA98 TaxID=3402163 RepID=UPI003AAAA469